MSVRKLGMVAMVVLLVSVLAGPAQASRASTRDLQEKLTLLGYEPGPIDGRMGPKTRAAVRAFQTDAEIKVDGVVGPQTRAALESALDMGGRRPTAANHQLDIYEDVLTDRLASGSATLPSRFAKVEVTRAAPGRYNISINGNVVASSPGANAMPRISHTFELPGEDAYVFAASSPRRDCRLEHTVLVVRADGSFLPPTPIGNCREILNGRVQGDSLVLSFPPVSVPSWRLEESWIYQAGQVVQR